MSKEKRRLCKAALLTHIMGWRNHPPIILPQMSRWNYLR